MRRKRTFAILLVLLCVGAFAPGSHAATKTPVILDTDIGDAIDDTWALGLLVNSPELDPKLIVSDFGKGVYRAKIIAKFLTVTGHGKIPIGIGLYPDDPRGNQSKWIEGYDLNSYGGKVHKDGVQAIIDTLMSSPRQVTIIAIGPCPNLAEALRRKPQIAQHAKLVGMFGSIRIGYDGAQTPTAEWNVKADPRACRAVLSAPWAGGVTITPIDICGLVRLSGNKYQIIHDSPAIVPKIIMENYRIWSQIQKPPAPFETASTMLFDPVAVYLAASQDLVQMETLKIRVTDDGLTVIDDANGTPMHVATKWKNLSGFEDFLDRRLASQPAQPATQPAQAQVVGNSHELLAGPQTPEDNTEWQAAMAENRSHAREELAARHLDLETTYGNPALQWARTSFIQPRMMAHERYFYDPDSHQYTVERYLKDVEARYGGIDSVLIWPTYPNIGVDNRNQYDLIRDMPGGIDGIKAMVADFHSHGVRVLFPFNPWDNGTRPSGMPHSQAIAQLVHELGADGYEGDTMAGVGQEFYEAALKAGGPLALEPENGLGNDQTNLVWDVMSRGYWSGVNGPVPAVDRYKWIEPRHLTHVCDRWAHDRNRWLQDAFFNGDGYESWENVWGIWNPLTQRDAEALRRIATIDRFAGDLLSSPNYQPHYPTLQPGVYASMFPANSRTLWTLINRSDRSVVGATLVVPLKPGVHYYDLWHGIELTPQINADAVVLGLDMAENGFGAVLAQSDAPDEHLQHLLQLAKQWSATPLSKLSHEWKPLPQQIVETPKTEPAAHAPAGMLKLPGGAFRFQVTGTEIEKSEGVDVQYPWEEKPSDKHSHGLTIQPFFIDKFPVTNAQFKRFLDATHYHPADDHNFLRDWQNGTFPQGWADKPVTWVSIEDARAYASWSGKRLPHEWEWQYAAQGADGRKYPWGSNKDPSAVPPPQTGRTITGPADVDAHPRGASPFGVQDLIGNVWNWTDEYRDEHTRAAVLRGGSYYQAQGSKWYFLQAYELTLHSKYLLMAPSLDRAATIGFRCVKDAAEGE